MVLGFFFLIKKKSLKSIQQI